MSKEAGYQKITLMICILSILMFGGATAACAAVDVIDLTVDNQTDRNWSDFHISLFDIRGGDLPSNIKILDSAPFQPTSSQDPLTWKLSSDGQSIDLFFYDDPFPGGATGANFMVYVDNPDSIIYGVASFPTVAPQSIHASGSLLVWPLIDNIDFTTIINISNRGKKRSSLECYSITIGPDGGMDQKIDFIVHLTPKEKFWWNTATGKTRTNIGGDMTKIPGLAQRRGYLFCFAVDPVTRREVNMNVHTGDATLFDGSSAFNYNAIPSQALDIVQDRILNLNGSEYTMASSQIMFEGFAAGAFGLIDGKLAVANIGIDFIESEQPDFNINVFCWNEDEVPFSTHIHYSDFQHYTLADLHATRFNLGTDAFHCATTSTHAIWAAFYQTAGNMAYGGNVWRHPKTEVPTKVVLPEVPLSN